MPAVTITTQLASVDANAGLQQYVNLTSPTTNYLSGTSGSSASAPPGQTGPGWATIGSGSGTSSTSSTSGTTTSVPSWAIYALVGALAWFGLKKLGG